jgi:hypothetical protein
MVETKSTSYRVGTFSGEIEIVELENDLLKISILAGRGADLAELTYKPKNFNLAWQTSTGWPTKKTPVNHPADVDSFLNGYPGGWQSVFPNGGAPSKYKGIEFGQHDEVSMLSWDYEIVKDHEEEISIKFTTFTQKVKFKYEKTFSLRKGEAIVFLDEKVTNLVDGTNEAMWGNHISFGEPFIDEFSRIEIDASTRVIPHPEAISSVGRRVGLQNEFKWPMAYGENGEVIDFSRIPAKNTMSEILYLHGFTNACYLVTSPTQGLAARVTWDRTNFPYLWFWQEFGGANEYPWFGKHFNIGLEPFSSYPTNGLAEAVSNGSALVFAPFEEKTSSLKFEVLELS